MTPRKFAFGGTSVVAVTEWLLFELLRTPYRPPHDMLTALGTEKYAVITVMGLIASLWAAALVLTVLLRRYSSRDLLHFAILLVAISAAAAYIVRHPHRSVTPWELLWM